MQYRQCQKIGKSTIESKKVLKFFYVVGFCILVVCVSLWGIVQCTGAQVAFLHAVKISEQLVQLEV